MPIVIKRTDGGVSIMRPAVDLSEVKAKDRARFIAGEVEKWQESHPGEYDSHREMPEEAIPQDRTFRNAWADTTREAVIDIDMGKARSIHMDRLRAVRNDRLKALDVEYQIALESGDDDKRQAIAAQKQALRDMPDTTDLSAIDTPEALAGFLPEVLKLK